MNCHNLITAVVISALLEQNKQLQERAAGYDRLRAAHDQLKARAGQLEIKLIKSEEAVQWNYQLRQGLELEMSALKGQQADFGHQIVALAAERERSELLEQWLAASDARVRELEAALAIAKLPAGSRDNVIQLVREAA